MDLSQIRAFLAVCETKSFTKAARQINMSQPSISLKIKALEKHLGAKLLVREQNNLRLTDEGSYAEEKFLDIIGKTISNRGILQPSKKIYRFNNYHLSCRKRFLLWIRALYLSSSKI
jgi:hypothetical protein